MAGSLNRVQLIGNLSRDPEIRSLQNGSKVADLSIATSESWTDRATGEKKEAVEWHRVVIWIEPIVKVVEQYLRKGSKVMVEGQLKIRKWQDQSGADRYTTEIVLSGYQGQLLLLGDAGGGDGRRGPPPADQPPGAGSGPMQRQQGSASGQQGYPYNTLGDQGGGPAGGTRSDLDDEIPF